MRIRKLTHVFVDTIPDALDEGILYVCIRFGTAAHLCCCGCRNEVITPITPSDWTFSFDGETISLVPSIGNWSFDCRSHYWIQRNRIRWAPTSTRVQIERARALDRAEKAQRYSRWRIIARSCRAVRDLAARARRRSGW